MYECSEKGGHNIGAGGIWYNIMIIFHSGNFSIKGTLRGGQAPTHKHIDTLLKYVEDRKVVDLVNNRAGANYSITKTHHASCWGWICKR